MEGPILIVDVLGVNSILSILLKHGSVKNIYYLLQSRGKIASFFIWILKRRGCRLKPIQYDLSFVNGISPFFEMHKTIIEQMEIVKEKVFSDYMKFLPRLSDTERSHLLAFLGKISLSEVYFFIQLLIVLNYKFPYKTKINAILLKQTIFSEVVKNMYERYHFSPSFYTIFKREKILSRENYFVDRTIRYFQEKNIFKLAGKMLIFFFWVAYYRLYVLLLNLISKKKKNVKKHSICALVFSGEQLSNCLPWVIEKSDELKKDILVIHATALSLSDREFYARKADRLVACDIGSSRGSRDIEIVMAYASTGRIFLKNVWNYKKWLIPYNRILRWIFPSLMEMLLRSSFYEVLFIICGTKILWTMSEDDFECHIVNMALKRIDGTSLGTTWSQALLPVWSDYRNQNDILFVWGKRMENVRMKNRDQCRTYITAGFPADDQLQAEFEKAEKLRVGIPKEKRVLTFFDNIAAFDTFIAPSVMLALYEELFSWLNEDNQNFLIIKAKREHTISQSTLLWEKISDLYRQKRLDIIYSRSSLYPGLAADIVMGCSLTLPSLCAMLNCPTIIYDQHHLLDLNPMTLPNLVVVKDKSKIKPTIQELFKRKQKHDDFEKLYPSPCVDSFADGHSHLRIHGYISDLLGAYQKGYSGKYAQGVASMQYKDRWGDEYIASK